MQSRRDKHQHHVWTWAVQIGLFKYWAVQNEYFVCIHQTAIAEAGQVQAAFTYAQLYTHTLLACEHHYRRPTLVVSLPLYTTTSHAQRHYKVQFA